jgi:UDP-glucose 4-epimerase
MVDAFQRYNDVKLEVSLASRRAGDVAVAVANCDEAKAVLGWEPKRSLQEMCTSTWNWESKFIGD